MDNVNKPKHYELDGLEGIEVKDVIRSVLGDNITSFYIGNVIKYVLRYKKKNGVEDLKKARLYLDWAIADYDTQTKLKPKATEELLADVLKNTTVYSANGYIDRAVYTDPETHETTSIDINDDKYGRYIVRQVYAEGARNEEKSGEDC